MKSVALLGAEMVIKGGKKNEKETASLGVVREEGEDGKRIEETKWRYNLLLDGGPEMVVKGGKKNKKEMASLGRLGRRMKKEQKKENGGEIR